MSWRDDNAPARQDILMARALRLAAKEPFAQKGVPAELEDIIGDYLFDFDELQPARAPPLKRNLQRRIEAVLREGKKSVFD
jgi:hypothetical protein